MRSVLRWRLGSVLYPRQTGWLQTWTPPTSPRSPRPGEDVGGETVEAGKRKELIANFNTFHILPHTEANCWWIKVKRDFDENKCFHRNSKIFRNIIWKGKYWFGLFWILHLRQLQACVAAMWTRRQRSYLLSPGFRSIYFYHLWNHQISLFHSDCNQHPGKHFTTVANTTTDNTTMSEEVHHPVSYHAAYKHHEESSKCSDGHLISSTSNCRAGALPSHFPPLLLQLCQHPLQQIVEKQYLLLESSDLLNETDDTLRDGGWVRGVLWHRNGVTLAVKEPAQLLQVALPLYVDI